jgi:hypothetical protein
VITVFAVYPPDRPELATCEEQADDCPVARSLAQSLPSPLDEEIAELHEHIDGHEGDEQSWPVGFHDSNLSATQAEGL